MKSRKSKFCLILLFSVLIVALCTFNLFAAESLTITDPADGAWVSYLDAPDVEWDKVTGAAGYRVSIRNTQTGELLVENKWTTKTYYSLDGKLDRAASEYKIWVGAMNSKDDNGEQAFSSDYITIYTYKEAPEIDGEGYKNVTSDSVVLYMEITRDNGESVTDSGFYLEEATSSKRTTYSFKNYGSYSATTKGYKEMTITGL